MGRVETDANDPEGSIGPRLQCTATVVIFLWAGKDGDCPVTGANVCHTRLCMPPKTLHVLCRRR
jgi:hypothetical protein